VATILEFQPIDDVKKVKDSCGPGLMPALSYVETAVIIKRLGCHHSQLDRNCIKLLGLEQKLCLLADPITTC
jgi:hypothetical protein